jgi:hypothetical protein
MVRVISHGRSIDLGTFLATLLHHKFIIVLGTLTTKVCARGFDGIRSAASLFSSPLIDGDQSSMVVL